MRELPFQCKKTIREDGFFYIGFQLIVKHVGSFRPKGN